MRAPSRAVEYVRVIWHLAVSEKKKLSRALSRAVRARRARIVSTLSRAVEYVRVSRAVRARRARIVSTLSRAGG